MWSKENFADGEVIYFVGTEDDFFLEPALGSSQCLPNKNKSRPLCPSSSRALSRCTSSILKQAWLIDSLNIRSDFLRWFPHNLLDCF